MQPVACGCYKGVTLCDLHSDNIQIASPVTGHMSMRTLWVSWETVGSRVPDGRTGFYRNRRGSSCRVLNLAMCSVWLQLAVQVICSNICAQSDLYVNYYEKPSLHKV